MQVRTIAALSTFIVLAGCSQLKQVIGGGGEDPLGAAARAELIDAQQRVVGRAAFEPTPTGMLIRLTLTDATPGTHGIHLHQVGSCLAPGFESAGGHLNPFARKHGFRDAAGPHAGDLPNIVVPEGGQLQVELLAREVTLSEGAAALLDTDGAAIVLHAGADDYRTDPAGDSGPRIACGIIRR